MRKTFAKSKLAISFVIWPKKSQGMLSMSPGFVVALIKQ